MVPQYGSSPPPSTPPPFKPMSDCSPSSSRDSEDSEAGSAYTINSSSEGSDADGEFELDDGYESEFVEKDLEEGDEYIPGQDEGEEEDVDYAFVAEHTPPPGSIVVLHSEFL
ncbi:unnamed protein product [Tilletia caries]|uniref:Uncharacterized protein n=1 Tax=Tilletia caries TaxID=13290 RepID=A0ABN7ISP8_9BASI|nr:unnamed protein product [Tilletia caries]